MTKNRIQEQKAPRGYKETKIGLIPDDWEFRHLGDCCRGKPQYGANAASVDYEPPLPRYIRITDITEDGELLQTDKKSIPNEKANGVILNEGDFLFARTGATVGKTYLHHSSGGVYAFAGYLIRFVPDTRILLPEYLKFYTETNKYWDWVKNTTRAGAQPNINGQEYRGLKIPCPPIGEQKAIVNTLSLWQNSINRTKKLISLKKNLKKALCQQLLTGKKRPRGFSSRWKQSQLSNLAEIIVSNVDKKINSHETPVLLCNYLDVYRNHYITNQLNFMEGRATKTEIEKFKLQMDDVIITKDSETPDDIAKAATVTENLKNVLCGYHLAILRPKQDVLSGLYLGQYLMLPSVRYQFTRVANGATRFGLAVSSIEEVVIDYPTFDEQQKIAEILTNCDNEIELLNCKVELMKHQKRGLMQKLLTGKIRVKFKD